MGSKFCEINSYMHELDLLTILHKLCVSYPTRNGCKEKIVHLEVNGFSTVTYLNP